MEKDQLSKIKSLLESNLLEISLNLESQEDGELVNIYRRILFFYLQSDIPNLENAVAKLNELPNVNNNESECLNLLKLIGELRLNLRKRTLSEELILKSKEFIDALEIAPFILGEYLMVLAIAAENYGLYNVAFYRYQKAAKCFSESHNFKRHCTCHFGMITAQSKIDPERRFLTEYQMLAAQALTVNNFMVAGLAFHNLSLEYIELGSYQKALNFSNRAVGILKEHYYGTQCYYLSLLRRLDIFIHQKMWNSALEDFDECSNSNFLEIKNSLKKVQVIITAADVSKAELDCLNETSISESNFYWNQKFEKWLNQKQEKTNSKISELNEFESQIVELLSKQDLSIKEIVMAVFGDSIDFDSAINRIRVALSRLKKKCPDLISRSGQKYFLTQKKSTG